MLGYAFRGPDLTQASGSLSVPTVAGSGTAELMSTVIAANGVAPTDWYVLLFGANQTVTSGLIWGWDATATKWYQIYALDTPFTITSATQGVGRRITGIGPFDKLALSGTASVGAVTVIFRPLGLVG